MKASVNLDGHVAHRHRARTVTETAAGSSGTSVALNMIEADTGDELLPMSLRSSPIRKTKLFDQFLHFEVGMHGLLPGQLH